MTDPLDLDALERLLHDFRARDLVDPPAAEEAMRLADWCDEHGDALLARAREAEQAEGQWRLAVAEATNFIPPDVCDVANAVKQHTAEVRQRAAAAEAERDDARNYAAEIAQGVSHYPHTASEPCVRCERDRLRAALRSIACNPKYPWTRDEMIDYALEALASRPGAGEGT